MFCTQCGFQLRDDNRFCSRCGARTGVGWATYQPHPLMLDKRNKKVAGVCAGLARHFGEDVTLIRIIFLALAFTTGIGFLAYLAAWILMPSDYYLQARVAPQPYPAP